MICKFPRFTLAAVIALSTPLALVQPAASASAQSPERTSYVLFSQGNSSTTMSGSTEDLEQARSLRNGREALLYARVDGAAYIIRDPATLRRAEAVFEP